MPFWKPHLDIMFPKGTIGMETLKGDWVNSMYVTEEEHRLSLPANTYHVNESPGGK